MTYEPQDWHDGPDGGTPISAARLNHIEAGIRKATTDALESIPATVAAALAADDAPAQAAAAAVTTELVHGEAGRIYAPRTRAAAPLPLRDPVVTPRGTDPIPTDSWGGYVWGVDGGTIKRSTDGGRSWQTYTQVPEVGTAASSIARLLPTHDGEVLVVTSTKVLRSTGWASGTPTWATVLTNPTPSFFHPWGFSGDGTKFVLVHYSGSGTQTPDRADSRYGWISLDGGLTWAIKWDTRYMFGETINAETHIHAAAYDPWEDRFFIAEGHVSATGVYVSDDDGDTWTRLSYGTSFDSPPGNAPTTITPTDAGVVFGSDDPTNGVMVLPRGTSTIERAWSQMGVSNSVLFGYAHMGARDPRTGMVYMVWENNQTAAADLPVKITASDGQVAGQVWQADPAMYLWRRVVVDDHGHLLAWEQSTDSILRATTAEGGAVPVADTGRVLGGRVTGGRGAVAVGPEASATGNGSVAVGGGAATAAHRGVAIGHQATSQGTGQAIGYQATADANGTALGYQAAAATGTAVGNAAVAANAASTAVGRGARASTLAGSAVPSATAVGRDAQATAASGHTVALGANAVASGTSSLAIGSGATASGSGALAIGRGAVADFNNSVAVGNGATVNGINQYSIGNRGLLMEDVPASPVAPVTGAFLYVQDGELRVRFPNGTVRRVAFTD